MAGLIGADVEALERLAADFESGAAELRELSNRLAGSIDAAHDWQGPDAVRCKEEWGTFAQERMVGVSDALATAGRLLSQNAQEQERASGAESGTTAAGYGVLRFLGDLKAIASYLAAPVQPVMKAKALFDYVRLLRAANLGDLAAAGKLAEALDVLKNGSRSGGVLGWLGMPALGRLVGRAFVPLTVLSGAADVFTGGGYDGWKGWATRGFGLIGAAGAVTLMVASAPVTLAVAGGAVVAYSAWSAYAYLDENWGAVKQSASRIWNGATSGVDSALTWARGLLGGGPRLAGAGT